MWNFIKNILGMLGDFLKEFIQSNAGKMVEEIGDIAYDVVERMEKKGGDNKFESAKKALINELVERGIEYTDNILNTAIEIAVSLLKERGAEIKQENK